jgi:hypothetical protein
MKSFVILLYLFMMVPKSGKTIEDYRWKKRIVITNFSNVRLDSILEGKAKSIEERKLLFVEFEHREYIKNTEQDEVDPDTFIKVLSRTTPNAEWVLIGLDGGVKASGAYKDFSLKKIFQLIDQMPMRQSEIDK